MFEIILDWIKINAPIIFLYIVVGVVVWIIAKFYFKRFEKIEKTVSNLPCNSRKEELLNIKNATTKLDSICEQLTEITKWIIKLDPSEIDILAPKFSPRKMTTAGRNLYDISGAKTTIENNQDLLIESLKKENPQTPLDVEDKAYIILTSKLSEPIFNEIKNFIYFQPERISVRNDEGTEITITLSLTLLLRLMSIDLRDKYLEKYPLK